MQKFSRGISHKSESRVEAPQIGLIPIRLVASDASGSISSSIYSKKCRLRSVCGLLLSVVLSISLYKQHTSIEPVGCAFLDSKENAIHLIC